MTILLSIRGITDIKYCEQLDQEFDDVNSPIQGQKIELGKKWNGEINKKKKKKIQWKYTLIE